MLTERKLVRNAQVKMFGATWNIDNASSKNVYLHKVDPAPAPGEAHEIHTINFFRLVQMVNEGKASIVTPTR